MTDLDPRGNTYDRPQPLGLGEAHTEYGTSHAWSYRRGGNARPRPSAFVSALTRRDSCADCNLAVGRHLHLHVAAAPGEVRQVRTAVQAALSRWHCPFGVIDDSVLLASEMVTNAVLHGADTTITVDLVHLGDRLLVEVTDASPARPVVRRTGADDEHGRGMQLVECIATAWGSRRDRDRGKTTWCTLALDCGGTSRGAR
ncbi:ATP-binding protein [Streptomyces sp. NPDC058739]|uniref:ATP-binding protein n=1 Tax=Streptomyces sp. NPDC058739 TaxID=3346618 RepID=UPI0036854B92